MSEQNEHLLHSISYWESRQINIGNYENIGFGATAVVKYIKLNEQEQAAQISESVMIKGDIAMTNEQAVATAQRRVMDILDAREKTIRLMSNSNGGTEFDTLKKAQDFGIIKADDIGLTEVSSEAKTTGGVDFKKLAEKQKARKDLQAEIDEEFADFGPSKPVKPKNGKSKFQLKSGLFADSVKDKVKTKPPKFDDSDEIPF